MAERGIIERFRGLMTMIENTDKDEYIDKRRDVTDMIELSNALTAAYLCWYNISSVNGDVRRTPPGETKKVLGLKTFRKRLFAGVNETAVQGLIHINSWKNKKVVKKV